MTPIILGTNSNNCLNLNGKVSDKRLLCISKQFNQL